MPEQGCLLQKSIASHFGAPLPELQDRFDYVIDVTLGVGSTDLILNGSMMVRIGLNSGTLPEF
jgi:hypothetical protein